MKILEKIKFPWQPNLTIYQKITQACLLALAFLLPVFILPVTQDYLEIGKTAVFYFLSTIASLSCLGQIVIKKRYKSIKHKMILLVVIFFLLYVISTLFSVNWRVSLVGLAGYYNDSLITVLLLITLYLVASSTLEQKKDFLKLFYSLLLGAAVVVIFTILQLCKIHIFPQSQSQTATFNLVANSVSVLAIFLALIVPMVLAILLVCRKRLCRGLLIALGSSSLILLFLFDNLVGWFTLVVGLFIFLVFLAWRSREIPTFWVIIPTVLIVLSILLIFVSVSDLTGLNLNNDIVLGQNNSWQVVWQTMKTRFLTGTGPETFHYALTANRPLSFNNHPYWALSFVKANSQWSQVIANLGILNFLVLAAIVFYSLFKGAKKILAQKISEDCVIDMVIMTATASLFLAGFVYSYNIVLSYLFWLFLALGTARFLLKDRKEISIEKNQKKNLWYTIGSSIWSVVAIVMLVMTVRFYLAEYYVQRAQQSIANLEEIAKVEEYFIRATKFNPLSADYYFNLAESNLIDVGLKAQQGESDYQDVIKQAAAAINQAVKMENESVRALLRKAALYRDFRRFVTDTQEVVFANFEKAKAKSPSDPLIYFEIGRSYLLYAQDWLSDTAKASQVAEYLAKAETSLLKAVELKNSLIEAHYLLAQTYDWQGQSADEETKAALKQKIITELETILFYNPDNQEVKDYLDQIKKETS